MAEMNEKVTMPRDRLDFDVTAPEFETDQLDPGEDNTVRYWARVMTLYQERAHFWQERLNMGRKCARYMRRQIFTAEQKDVYTNTLNKIVVEPQEVKPVINSLMRAIRKRVNPGTVSMEDSDPPENTAKPEVTEIVLKWMQNHLKLDRRQKDALRTGLNVGCPQCLWFDRVTREGGLTTDLQATLLRWDSTLPSPWFEEADASDIDDMIYADYRTKAQMLDAMPDRAEALKKHDAMLGDPGHYTSVLAELSGYSSKERATLLADQIRAQSYTTMNGRYFIVQHAFPVKKKQTLWYSQKLERATTFPEDWPQWRKDMWLGMNPDFDRRMTREVKTLWISLVGADGFVWYNGPSWYQYNGELPCAWFVADLVDMQPTGVTEDLLPYVFATAVSETEGLDQVRKGTGSLLMVKEGMVRNPEAVGDEVTKPDGVLFFKDKSRPVGEAVTWRDRKPNDTYLQYGDRQRSQMKEVHNVHPAMMGKFGGRQSDKAKKTELDESMGPQSAYVENYASFVYATNARLLSFFPWVLNNDQIVAIEDEFGDKQQEQINQIGYDYTGQAQIVANDLMSARWKYIPKASDDSELSRESQMRDFVEMLEAFGNSLMQRAPKLMASILQAFPNKFARQAGKFLAAEAEQMEQQAQAASASEAQAEKAKQASRSMVELMKLITPRMMMKTDATDIAESPEGFKVFYEWFLSQQAQAQEIAGRSLAVLGVEGQQQQQQLPAPQPPGGQEQPQGQPQPAPAQP